MFSDTGHYRNFKVANQKMTNLSKDKQISRIIYERIGLRKKPKSVIKTQISQLQITDETHTRDDIQRAVFLEFIGTNYTTEKELEDFIL